MHFGIAVEVVRLLRLTEVVPPLLVVGIGYRTTDLGEIFRLRHRDFTPMVDGGGADRFLAFLRNELKPWVGERYNVDPDDATFFGDSRGGLFASAVLLTEPGTFQRYGIGSPSLYADEGVKSVFELEADYARAHNDLPAKVFFSVGGHESPEGFRRRLDQLPPAQRARMEADPGDWGEDYVGDIERLVGALRARGYPSLELECEILPGEHHETVVPVNLSRSLRYLFDAPR